MQTNVLSGSITDLDADALITAINSGRMWCGGIDGVIAGVAGDFFHRQAAFQQLQDGLAIVAAGNGTTRFRNVIFVVDDLCRPLRDVLLTGLQAADEAGFRTVSLPTIRMGVMAGVRESPLEVIAVYASTLREFAETARYVEKVSVVIFNDPAVERAMSEAILGGASPAETRGEPEAETTMGGAGRFFPWLFGRSTNRPPLITGH